MAPLAQLDADNIAAYIMREKFQYNVDRVTTQSRACVENKLLDTLIVLFVSHGGNVNPE